MTRYWIDKISDFNKKKLIKFWFYLFWLLRYLFENIPIAFFFAEENYIDIIGFCIDFSESVSSSELKDFWIRL